MFSSPRQTEPAVCNESPWKGSGSGRLPKPEKRFDSETTWHDGRAVLAIEPRKNGLRLHLIDMSRTDGVIHHNFQIPTKNPNRWPVLFGLGKTQTQNKLNFLIEATSLVDDRKALSGLRIGIYRRPSSSEENYGDFGGEYQVKRPRLSLTAHYTLAEVIDLGWDSISPDKISITRPHFRDHPLHAEDENLDDLNLDALLSRRIEQQGHNIFEGEDS